MSKAMPSNGQFVSAIRTTLEMQARSRNDTSSDARPQTQTATLPPGPLVSLRRIGFSKHRRRGDAIYRR